MTDIALQPSLLKLGADQDISNISVLLGRVEKL
jgi:hypothetical protein